ncbi:MAG: NUDIX domain-containing protein [bacterium]
MSTRFQIILAVYLIFRQGNKVLLLKRANTGYADGKYSIVAGHVDAGESFVKAAIREAKEEAGILVEPDDLKLALTLHRQREDGLVDMNCFFEVGNYSGEIKNNEPGKCDDLSWFDEDNLPENTLDYVRFALEKIAKGEIFATWGW